MATQIPAYRTMNFRVTRNLSEVRLARLLYLILADALRRGRFLLIVDAKAGEESRKAQEAKSGCTRPEVEIPIESVLKAFVKLAHVIPDAGASEYCLLRRGN